MRNTSHIGEISRTQIIAALTLQGKTILLPLSDHQRYDLVIEDHGIFQRVQCKTGRLRNGVIRFVPCSIDSRSKPGGRVCRSYRGEIDLFGVYCPDNNKCYLVPVGKAGQCGCHLRIALPQNGQKTRILWADEYEIQRRVELAGIEPATL